MFCTSPQSDSTEVIVGRVKLELRLRYARDERPTAWEYLERFPRLREDRDRAVSLIYEEFCLLEEAGKHPDAEEFCRRYPTWRDSLELQLRCHRELGEVAGVVLSAPPLLEPGDRFHGFLIESILGRGGMSHVYLAYEEAMGGRPVALKISSDRGSEPGIIGCLDHPRIMPAFSVWHEPARGLRGLCMPYRAGAPLDTLIRRSWPLRDSHGALAFWTILAQQGEECAPSLDWPGWLGFPSAGSYEDGVAWIVLAVAQAVSHIHTRGVIHCDIKPANVYVGAHDGPLLFDFGFARSRGARDPLPGGTLAYMAPEQLRACLDPGRWSEVGEAADIYALGVTLVELLLGTLPDTPLCSSSFQQATREQLGWKSRPGWSALKVLGTIPPRLEEIVQGCLDPRPERRHADARDLARGLARFLALSSTSSAVPELSQRGLAATSIAS